MPKTHCGINFSGGGAVIERYNKKVEKERRSLENQKIIVNSLRVMNKQIENLQRELTVLKDGNAKMNSALADTRKSVGKINNKMLTNKNSRPSVRYDVHQYDTAGGNKKNVNANVSRNSAASVNSVSKRNGGIAVDRDSYVGSYASVGSTNSQDIYNRAENSRRRSATELYAENNNRQANQSVQATNSTRDAVGSYECVEWDDDDC